MARSVSRRMVLVEAREQEQHEGNDDALADCYHMESPIWHGALNLASLPFHGKTYMVRFHRLHQPWVASNKESHVMERSYLNREDCPLTAQDWNQIDTLVVDVARRMLVGRRFIHIFGPMGVGIQDVDYDMFSGTGPAQLAVFGETETSVVKAAKRVHENIPLVYKDFMIYWRDIETSRQMGMPLDISAAAAASAFVAQREDQLIFNGDEECGYEGLASATGRLSIPARDWGEAGNGFQDLVDATASLLSHGFYGPYAVIVNPKAYSKLHRVYANSGVLEINHLREIATAGVFQSPTLTDIPGLVVSCGIQNFDLAIGQDLVTAYLGAENMNHPFRVFESLVLRIKRPQAICTFEPASRPKSTPEAG